MKCKIIIVLLLMMLMVACKNKEVNDMPTDTSKSTHDDQSLVDKTDDNSSIQEGNSDNTVNDENNQVKDNQEKETQKENRGVDRNEVNTPIKRFLGDWKVKASFDESLFIPQEVSLQEQLSLQDMADESFFLKEELPLQDNGIGIYTDHIIIYAYEVNDYILCNIEIEEIQENSLSLKIKDRKNSSGRIRQDNTQLILKLDEENNIIKANFMKETEDGTYIDTYIYEKDEQGFLRDFYLAKKQEEDKLDNAQLESISRKIGNEWFRDYRNIKENEYLRFDEYNGIESYSINEHSIWSNYYDLEGKLSYKSGEETYKIIEIKDNTAILQVEKEQGKSENIIGLYYTIQLQGDKAYIRKFDYLSNNMYLFDEQKVVNDSLDLVITTANHMNNLFAFGEEQKKLFNKMIGNWGTLKDGSGAYIYNLIITPYYIDFFEYATGFIESLNFKILDINVEEKTMLIDINQYSWWDEVSGETKYLDNQIVIKLNEEESKLHFQIVHEQNNQFFEMAKDYINEVEFEKIQEE